MNLRKVLFLAIAVFFIWSTKGQTDMAQIKVYKEVFPDAKLKCIDCHVDAVPKKEEGRHDWNEYGKKVKETAAKAKPTAETYKTVGKVEDFKGKEKE